MAENIKLRERSIARMIVAHYAGSPIIKLWADGENVTTHDTSSESYSTHNAASATPVYKTMVFTCDRSSGAYIFQLSADTSDIMAMQLISEPASSYMNKLRFISAELQYMGEPKVQLYVDGHTKISSPNHAATALDEPAETEDFKTATLYFPPESIGYVPHLEATLGGEVLNVKYNS